MPNPGAFRGSRKEFLLSQKDVYAESVQENCIAEALSLIQRKYFKRFPVDLPHEEEPTAEFLASIDDDDPDPEHPPPYADGLSEEEYQKCMEKYDVRQKLIQHRKSQIKRWMSYQYMKDHDLNSKESGAHGPYRALLQKMTGKDAIRPRRKAASNVWRRTHRDEIENRVKVYAAAQGMEKKHFAALRDRFSREMFGKLSEEEKKRWVDQAEVEYNKDLEAWKESNNAAISTASIDRQRAIQGLVHFCQPLVDYISDVTGWKATLLAGGPEPAHDGKLNMIRRVSFHSFILSSLNSESPSYSIHSGTTCGDVKMNFGMAERLRYKQYIVPIFGSFLQKCYTPDECRSRALRGGDELSLISFDFDSTVNVDTISPAHGDSHANSATDRASPPPPYGSTSDELSSPHISITRQSSSSESSSPTQPASVPSSLSVTPAANDEPPPHTFATRQSLPLEPSSSTQPASAPNSPNVTPAASPNSISVTLPTSCEFPTTSFTNDTAHSGTEPYVAPVASSNSLITDILASTLPGLATASFSAAGTLSTQVSSVGTTSNPPLESPPARIENPPSSDGLMRAGKKRTSDEVSTDSLAGFPPKRARVDVPIPSSGPETPVTSSSNVNLPASLTSLPSPPISPLSPPAMHTSSHSSMKTSYEWLRKGMETLQSADLGPEWKKLVDIWFVYADGDAPNRIGSLPTRKRPAEVGIWMKRHRVSNFFPNIDAISFGQAFIDWYTTIQPSWRVVNGTIDFSVIEGNWDVFRKSGPNGSLIVMVALFYWGLAAQKEKGSTHSNWLVYVDDCCRIFTLFSETHA